MADNKERMQVIATTEHGRDITRGYVDNLPLLPPTDPVLREKYRSLYAYGAYRELLTDDQVFSTTSQRRLALISKPWEVVPGGKMRRDKSAADFVRETLEHIRWNTVCDRMWYAVFFGYAVAECIYQRDGQRTMLDRLRVRNHCRFAFAPDFSLKLLTTQKPNGEDLPEQKFWYIAAGAAHDDEPYGLGLGHYLYWPVFFKRNGTKYWTKFLDKFGSPTIIGKFSPDTLPADQNKLLNSLSSLRSDGAMTIPENMAIELLEASRNGRPEYGGFYQQIDAAIAKVVVGQTMTTDQGSSRSQAEVHFDVREEKIKADAHLIDESFTRSVVKWLVEWNFPGAALPKVRRVFDEGKDTKERAERDRILLDMGYRVSKRHIEDAYGVEVEDIGVAQRAPAPNNPLEFAELGDDVEDALDEILAAIGDDATDAIAEGLIRPILDAAEQNPEGLQQSLGERYPEMDSDALQDLLARIIFVAETWGRLNAGEG